MLQHIPAYCIEREGIALHTRCMGSGPALLLLHGHPQSMTMWHRVLPALAKRFTVVLMDLRGYGDSTRPPPDTLHMTHSKREMALDALAVMSHYGFNHFDVLAHDRGARVAHRLAVDHPQAVRRWVLLDIAPTLSMYEQTSEAFARAYWHWFFLIQPGPLPEALIASDPARYVRSVMGSRHAGLGAFDALALAEYERCAALPGTADSICEDYRAGAGVDLEHDRADVDANVRLAQPLRVLWGAHGAVGRCFDVLVHWRARANQVSGRSLPCGHYIAEELPDAVVDEAFRFFD
ncbi:MAG TPA: alpha/beta hydrolase [Hydrogenophaga sp.]|nr:alpha/beta hydrolase [Hydrogenophaga sp.]